MRASTAPSKKEHSDPRTLVLHSVRRASTNFQLVCAMTAADAVSLNLGCFMCFARASFMYFCCHQRRTCVRGCHDALKAVPHGPKDGNLTSPLTQALIPSHLPQTFSPNLELSTPHLGGTVLPLTKHTMLSGICEMFYCGT